MAEWRELHARGVLEGLDSEVHVWQQPNAYADDDIMEWYYAMLRRLAGSSPLLTINDAASCHWSKRSKDKAKAVNMVMVQNPRGMTMPAQLTDVEFACAKAATEPITRGQLLREKKMLGEPLRLSRHDMCRLCLAQHRYTVKMNRDDRAVVLGDVAAAFCPGGHRLTEAWSTSTSRPGLLQKQASTIGV